jgi:hypothetical protein
LWEAYDFTQLLFSYHQQGRPQTADQRRQSSATGFNHVKLGLHL